MAATKQASLGLLMALCVIMVLTTVECGQGGGQCNNIGDCRGWENCVNGVCEEKKGDASVETAIGDAVVTFLQRVSEEKW